MFPLKLRKKCHARATSQRHRRICLIKQLGYVCDLVAAAGRGKSQPERNGSPKMAAWDPFAALPTGRNPHVSRVQRRVQRLLPPLRPRSSETTDASLKSG